MCCASADASTEWIKGLLAVPFVLYSQPTGVFDNSNGDSVSRMAEEAHRRYAEILHDVERMIDDHSMSSSHLGKETAHTEPGPLMN